MEFIQGTVTHCQHTANVYGGAPHVGYTTGYITLFRVDGRPVEMYTKRPVSLADGDQVIAAGPRRGHAVEALSCRNVTTGEATNAGFWGNVFSAVLVTGIVVIVDGVGYIQESYWWLLPTPFLLLLALLCANRAWLVRRAARTVAMAVSHGTVRRL